MSNQKLLDALRNMICVTNDSKDAICADDWVYQSCRESAVRDAFDAALNEVITARLLALFDSPEFYSKLKDLPHKHAITSVSRSGVAGSIAAQIETGVSQRTD